MRNSRRRLLHVYSNQRMLPNSIVRGGDNASRWATLMSGDFRQVIKDLLLQWRNRSLEAWLGALQENAD